MKNKLPRKYKVIIIFQFVMIVFLFYYFNWGENE